MKKKRGRKRRPNIARTAEGRISRSQEVVIAQERLAVESATWKRRQVDPSLTLDEARKPEHGSVIAKWLTNHQGFARRYPGQSNEHEFTQTQYDAALRFHELHADWLRVIEARQMRSASDIGGVRGRAGGDPFEAQSERRHAAIEARFKEARRAILESCPLGMMAVEAIVLENQPVENLRADLRCALNRLAALWKISQAA